MPTTVTIEAVATGLATGQQRVGPVTFTSSYVPVCRFVNLISGNNSILRPTGAGPTLIFIPPPTNTATIAFYAILSTHGIAVHPTLPTLYTLDAGVPSVFVHTNGAVAGVECLWI